MIEVFFGLKTSAVNVSGCSQGGWGKKGFVMGSRTQGVQEILEKKIFI